MNDVKGATSGLVRALEWTTIFGNPGRIEENFLKDFPDNSGYVLALQEASVLAVADGYAQATLRPALVNLHTVAGTGNALGNLVTALPQQDAPERYGQPANPWAAAGTLADQRERHRLAATLGQMGP